LLIVMGLCVFIINFLFMLSKKSTESLFCLICKYFHLFCGFLFHFLIVFVQMFWIF
jgi:hypothetical protein